MKLTYDTIKENIKTFELAKEKFPVIQKYIDGEITQYALGYLGLSEFAKFHDYIKSEQAKGSELIMENMTWKKLKMILITNTDLPRFKTYLKNRTQRQFNELLNDTDTYDRLLNGRFLTKPTSRRSGRRSGEHVRGLNTMSIPIINYVIQNDLEVTDKLFGVHWYATRKLTLEDNLVREMNVTEELLTSLTNTITESKVDFKKLNLDYITNLITERLRKLISIEPDTTVKCKKDVVYKDPTTGVVIQKYLTKDMSYKVLSSTIRGGYLSLYLTNDIGRNDWYPFSNFEDILYARNSILESLLDDK